jgi:hypothetical protein
LRLITEGVCSSTIEFVSVLLVLLLFDTIIA